MAKLIYERIYDKLEKLGIPSVKGDKHLKSRGFMDLSIDNLGGGRFAIAHNYIQNGDVIPDPDMELRIDSGNRTAEALTYQDSFGFRAVYPEPGKVDPRAKKDLNTFLNFWLTNLLKQGFAK